MVTGFEIVGLIGAVNSTLSLTERAVEKIQAYRKFDQDATKLCLRFDIDKQTLTRISSILNTLSKVEDVVLSEEDRRLHVTLNAHFESLKISFGSKIDGLPPPTEASFTAKSAWALWRKRDLEGLEKDLNDLIQRTHVILSVISLQVQLLHATGNATNPEARLRILVKSFNDLALQNPLPDSLQLDDNCLVKFGDSSRRMCGQYYFPDTTTCRVICEFRIYENQNTKDATRAGICDLAKVLYQSEFEQTRIPRCLGWVEQPDSLYHGIIFEVPPTLDWFTSPQRPQPKVLSLSDLLMKTPRFSLTHRLRFASELAKSILYVHLIGLVHKSIRPENIIFFEEKSCTERQKFPFALPKPILLGFDIARDSKAGSDRKSDADWKYNIYRHPKRQLTQGNSNYTVAHDVYSLGVVLLEVGLWGTFGYKPFVMCEDIFKDKDGHDVKAALERMATGTTASGEKGVSNSLGDAYANLVEYCLSIGENDEIASGAFIQNVWLRLDMMRSSMS